MEKNLNWDPKIGKFDFLLLTPPPLLIFNFSILFISPLIWEGTKSASVMGGLRLLVASLKSIEIGFIQIFFLTSSLIFLSERSLIMKITYSWNW